MVLRHEPDVSHAGWFTDRDEPWTRICSFGPSGFARYARLFHSGSPGEDITDPDALVNLEGRLPSGALQLLVSVLARHTSTAQDCFFGLWDGFGDIHGSPSMGLSLESGEQPHIPPAFPPEALSGPRVRIPCREYLLFRGPLHDAGQWGAADLIPGLPRSLNSPNLIWPADHAWFVATEIDLPWTGVAGSAELDHDLLTEPGLDVDPLAPTDRPPYWRTGTDPRSKR